VVVAPVDQDDIGIRVPQRMRRGEPGKTATDDDNPLAPAAGRGDYGRCLIRSVVR